MSTLEIISLLLPAITAFSALIALIIVMESKHKSKTVSQGIYDLRIDLTNLSQNLDKRIDEIHKWKDGVNGEFHRFFAKAEFNTSLATESLAKGTEALTISKVALQKGNDAMVEVRAFKEQTNRIEYVPAPVYEQYMRDLRGAVEPKVVTPEEEPEQNEFDKFMTEMEKKSFDPSTF